MGPAVRLLATCGALALWWVRMPALVLAASPQPTPGGGGDPRSSGQGPGLVGDPLFAIGLVVVIAVLSMVATLAYVRATTDRHAGSDTR